MTEQSKVAPVEAQAVPDQPVAWMWQHEETGMTGFVQHAPEDELRQWERMNRPRKIVAPLFTRPTPAAADLPKSWEDRDDEWTQAIDAAHPIHSGAHKQYATALEMVGNRHSKGALVELVCWLLQRASPVAPAGAPTDERIMEIVRYSTFGSAAMPDAEWIAFARALLCAQGCELATDATKQQREHSVHLALSTSSVPTAAPLLSSRETDRSELPREPSNG